MKSVLEFFLQVIITIIIGFSGYQFFYKKLAQKSIRKIDNGLSSLEIFSRELTRN